MSDATTRRLKVSREGVVLIKSFEGFRPRALRDEDWRIGLVIAAAMVLNLLVAATVGVLTPLTLSRLKFDPAVSSAVFVTATTDFFGFLIFLGLATIVLL